MRTEKSTLWHRMPRGKFSGTDRSQTACIRLHSDVKKCYNNNDEPCNSDRRSVLL